MRVNYCGRHICCDWTTSFGNLLVLSQLDAHRGANLFCHGTVLRWRAPVFGSPSVTTVWIGTPFASRCLLRVLRQTGEHSGVEDWQYSFPLNLVTSISIAPSVDYVDWSHRLAQPVNLSSWKFNHQSTEQPPINILHQHMLVFIIMFSFWKDDWWFK